MSDTSTKPSDTDPSELPDGGSSDEENDNESA
jgi:hypothetical protein